MLSLFRLSIVVVINQLIIATISFAATENNDEQEIIRTHAIAMHGEPKYPKDFSHFDYTSDEAVKGGSLKLHSVGSFDSLNHLIPKGNPADNIGLIYDTITKAAADEPFTQYGLLAHTIEYPKDRSWVIFHLRPTARFHDGKPITADDVVFTFNLLVSKGHPIFRFMYADVDSVIAIDKQRVKFSFSNNENKELPLIVGGIPILPKHYWIEEGHEFDKSALEIPLGSGPYKVKSIDAGRKITYEREKNYWGSNLAVNKYLYNFDTVSIDYYRDGNVALEALKSGEYDFRLENNSKSWATAYNIPAINNGSLIRKEVKHSANTGIQAFIFNTRRPLFKNMAARKAINYAFDFEWSNNALFYQAYKRCYSFFSNSEFAATELPTGRELEILEGYRDQLPTSVFTEAYQLPVTDGSGHNRSNLRIAKKLLEDAGYKVVNNQLMTPDGQPFTFELLLVSPAFERIVNPFVKNLSRLGITVFTRLVDTSQYINRIRSFDFDMLVQSIGQSESPGNEQWSYWGSDAADTQGSQNLIGIKNPIIDQLIKLVVDAPSRKELVYRVKALDRILLHHHYVVPQWYKSSTRLAYWDKFGMPVITPAFDRSFSTGIMSWWYDREKAGRLNNIYDQQSSQIRN